ncbi:MAG: HypC/HybG/HupF family hydrogenase formation chaperone [Planctomycetes bacterium]|nr:HypC/HybG/HupF family hydrogenase formation chaperone [Planctomycetota bacterium]
MCLAIPGKILDVRDGDEWQRTGRVDFGGVVKEVSLALVPDAGVGVYVLVHVGMALSTIGEAEAQEVFAYLRQLEPEDVP